MMSPYKKLIFLTFLITTIIANASAAIAPPNASSNRTSSLDLKISTPRALNPTSLPIAPEKNTPLAVKPTGKILQAETATLSDTISPAKRTDGPINPNIFYSTYLITRCATLSELRYMSDDPLNYREFVFVPRRRPRLFTEENGAPSLHEHLARRRGIVGVTWKFVYINPQGFEKSRRKIIKMHWIISPMILKRRTPDTSGGHLRAGQ
ncbi:hypothetical protein TWF751_010054 [Orbilia oligospora]|nr:hypothetical protein TWF751_010054 [Orbilia oligospora]